MYIASACQRKGPEQDVGNAGAEARSRDDRREESRAAGNICLACFNSGGMTLPLPGWYHLLSVSARSYSIPEMWLVTSVQ